MYNYIAIGFGILLVGLLIYAIVRAIISKPKAISNSVDIKDNRSKIDKLTTKLDKSATEIVENFLILVYDKESPYNREQRRRILRHYKKFLFAWPNLTPKQQDVPKIVSFIVADKCNGNIVNKYKFENSNAKEIVNNGKL